MRRGEMQTAVGVVPHSLARMAAPWRWTSAHGKKDPTLLNDLARLVEPETAGNPCTGEKWVRSRLRGLAKALGRRASPTTIGRLLRAKGYGLRQPSQGPAHGPTEPEFKAIQLTRHAVCPQLWNYTIHPPDKPQNTK